VRYEIPDLVNVFRNQGKPLIAGVAIGELFEEIMRAFEAGHPEHELGDGLDY